MENLVFSLNATIPVFLQMVLGIFLKKIGWIDDAFASKMNTFVFRVSLPVHLFCDLALVDLAEVWNVKFVLFCFVVTLVSITISTLLSFVWKDKSIRGEFIQASYRSSAALLGIAFIQNIYGTSGMAPMMIIGSVPLYNIMAVTVLSFFGPEQAGEGGAKEEQRANRKKLLKKTARNIVTNPLIIGILLGFLWSALRLTLPQILQKTLTNVGNVSTPLGLIAMGATFDLKKAFKRGVPSVVAAFIKLVGFAAVFLPVAVALGFRQEELVAILVMLGSATTVSCYVMARNMGHEGTLTSSTVMLTTLCSAFSLTGWLYLLRSFHWI